MKLIVGLGNPGKKYEKTRHNTGFMVLDKLGSILNVEINEEKFNSYICKFKYKNETVILMKPLTYMNESGKAVLEVVNFYKIDIKDILIVHDDLDLPYGKIRIRSKGSNGGHNGMKSIINLLHSEEISRIRVGIEKSSVIPVIDYVLGKVEKDKLDLFNESIDKAALACKSFLDNPIEKVMNEYN